MHKQDRDRSDVEAPWGLEKLDPKQDKLGPREILYLTTGDPMHPEEALEEWDRGNPVSTIEMGGIGPGYEQAIQILVFETIREALTYYPSHGWLAVPDLDRTDEIHGAFRKEFLEARDRAANRTNKGVGGYSGAQVDIAGSLAWNLLTKGWEACMKEVGSDRRILVSKHYPHLEKEDETLRDSRLDAVTGERNP